MPTALASVIPRKISAKRVHPAHSITGPASEQRSLIAQYFFHSRDGYGIRDIAYLSRLSQAVLRPPCWRENAPSKTSNPRAAANPSSADVSLPKRRGPGRPPNPVIDDPESLRDRRDMVSPSITDAHPTVGVGSGGRRITLALLGRRPIAGHRVTPAEELSLHSAKPSSKRRAPPQSSKSSAWPWGESI